MIAPRAVLDELGIFVLQGGEQSNPECRWFESSTRYQTPSMEVVMSRTFRKDRPWGFEFWSRRPFNRHGQGTGRFSKRRTHKAERQIGKRSADPDL
ncbi:hypothetical protein [Thioalkalivibrio sp. ALE16]|uniref:hypothetical protein n=1 Tax=Thioalkalivibrio sp. ALE16 TaxID=1158172 RepID=UPI0012DF7335|nr:hypothetical protein [Thioalkalivibrio sp. ALE16]